MSCPFNEEQLAQLKAFVSLCKTQPAILHHPKLEFFKDYLLSFGIKIPIPTFESAPSAPSGDIPSSKAEEKAASSEEESEPESDVELDMTGVIESAPLDESQEMGDPTKEATEEECDQSDEKRTQAMKAFSEQNYDEALKYYTEAIKLNPQSALLFAKRGQVYLKLNKLHSCIKDCTHAIELNCDSAAAYKFRGRAYRLLGKFEEASHDLCESLGIDYDDQTNEWLTEVKPNAEKIRQHKLSLQRKQEDKEHREKVRRARKVQEARANAAKAQAEAAAGAAAGGAPEGFQFPDFLKNQGIDEEIWEMFQDPTISAAMSDITANPANFVKYQNNPKIVAFFEKFYKNQANKGGAGAGAAAGANNLFGMPGFGGAPKPAPKSGPDDVDLD